MLSLDGFKEGFEVALTETGGTFALDDLEENRWAGLYGLGEDLEEVAFFVAVNEDAEFAQGADVFVDITDAFEKGVVIAVGYAEKLHTAGAQLADGADHVVSSDGDVLDTRAFVEVEVFFDLALF